MDVWRINGPNVWRIKTTKSAQVQIALIFAKTNLSPLNLYVLLIISSRNLVFVSPLMRGMPRHRFNIWSYDLMKSVEIIVAIKILSIQECELRRWGVYNGFFSFSFDVSCKFESFLVWLFIKTSNK